MEYQSPGIYQEAVSDPTRISPAETCLPLFIGYTEKATDINGHAIDPNQRMTIRSLAEYRYYFGNPPPATLQIRQNAQGQRLSTNNLSPFYLESCLAQFFANGGNVCEILSLGPYPDAPIAQDFASAIAQLPANPPFTMIAMPDAASLLELPFLLQQQLLAYCQQQHHCFAVLDVPYCTDDSLVSTVDNFRRQLGQANLCYGAAFLPWIEVTTLVDADAFADKDSQSLPEARCSTRLQSALPYQPVQPSTVTVINRAIPPSATIAALFQHQDRLRGIWKLPGNHAIRAVQALSVRVQTDQQSFLNIDTHGGKSINPIREFADRGKLLWGGRTLAGNDNEWRYITNVRTAGFIKASVHRYLDSQHFTSNDEHTWRLIRHTVEAFLETLWRDGGLIGASTTQAFFVRIGLNHTMTAQDLLDGRLVLEIGVAFIRPAEFTLLQIDKRMPVN